ncbi:MAG: tRNA-specific 2-thiouridylase MnmA [Evtepia sp.]|nr:tRNA-specific 2-thiouridylase MnmA [Evtepia sp.]
MSEELYGIRKENKSVLLGLSGGVDSAVSAALLQKTGFRVLGHFLDIGLGGEEDARKVAESLSIPFSTGDIRKELEDKVCAPFAEDYLAGKTPIPCARCNPAVKFPALFRAAQEHGADFVATGHYARIVRNEAGEAFLHRGQAQNDQAYMLARLPREFLPRILFPLGEYEKSQVRTLARGFGIPVAEKPDSMEICFIPDGDYAAWLEQRGKTPPSGNFVSRDGTVLGRHKGIHHYTLGQRRGLGISAENRLFVTEIRPLTNEVVLSDGGDLYAKRVSCEDLNLLAPIENSRSLSVRLRHSKVECPAVIHLLEGGGAELELLTEARAPTPGQLAVFYDGDLVLGSGWITGGG